MRQIAGGGRLNPDCQALTIKQLGKLINKLPLCHKRGE